MNKLIPICERTKSRILIRISYFFQFYLVVKGHGKNDESSMASKNGPGKFIAAKVRTAHASLSQQSNPTLGQVSSLCTDGKMTERDIQVRVNATFPQDVVQQSSFLCRVSLIRFSRR